MINAPFTGLSLIAHLLIIVVFSLGQKLNLNLGSIKTPRHDALVLLVVASIFSVVLVESTILIFASLDSSLSNQALIAEAATALAKYL